MSLSSFFLPIPNSVVENRTFSSIRLHTEGEFPDLKNVNIAFFTTNEYRGTGKHIQDSFFENEVRSCFYQLSDIESHLAMADLGSLRPTPSLEDTKDTLEIVCKELQKSNITLAILGGSHDLDFSIYKSYYSQIEREVNVITTDNVFDGRQTNIPTENHSLQMIEDTAPGLFSFGLLAIQRFLLQKDEALLLDNLSINIKSIGELRGHFSELEAMIRYADFLSFDMCSVKSFHQKAMDFGLSGEEAAQICWYAGLNEKLTVLGIFKDFILEQANVSELKNIVAVMLWYFLKGISLRTDYARFDSHSYQKYQVFFKNKKELTFYNSKLSSRWWLYGKSNFGFGDTIILPCTAQDYQMAIKGIYPDHIINQPIQLNKDYINERQNNNGFPDFESYVD